MSLNSTSQKVSRGRISPHSHGHRVLRFWRNCIDWLSGTWENYYRNIYYGSLIRKCRSALTDKRRGKLRRVMPCHHLLVRHCKHWPPPELPVSSCFTTHRIWQTWPPLTSCLFQNWKKSRKDGNLLTTMMLSAPRVARWRTKIKNSSAMAYGLWRITGPSAFLSKGTMMKSDKISC